MGIFLHQAYLHLCIVTMHLHENHHAMDKPTKLSVFLGRVPLLSRILRRRKSAFSKQRRLLRGDYNLF